jgi:hypothetical protein
MLKTMVESSLYISVICISVIIGIKTVQFFQQNHHDLVQRYKIAGYIIESCIALPVTALLFFNQEITGKFIIFLAEISKQVHSNKIVTLMLLIGLYFCVELYHAYEINKKSIDTQAIRKTISFHTITLILKLSIIIGTAIGFIDPIAKILEPAQIQKFDTIIYRFTTKEFFVYIHTIMMILLALWIMIGIYYFYKFYKKGK